MTEISGALKRILFPCALIERIKELLPENEREAVPSMSLVSLIADKASGFDKLSIRIADIKQYLEFLTMICSRPKLIYDLYFRTAYWQKLEVLQNIYNTCAGNISKLLLASYHFTGNGTKLPLAELSEIFFSQRQEYQYTLQITREIDDAFRKIESAHLPIGRQDLIRAAYCYFHKGLGEYPRPIPVFLYRIDNLTTGWNRLTVSGSSSMKEYFWAERAKTGKPISILMNHVIKSFLDKVLEAL